MPDGRHLFHGSHDADTIDGSVAVEVARSAAGWTFTLRSVDVGHSVPTGDLFRHLTLEVSLGNGPYQSIDRIGKVWRVMMGDDGEVHKTLADDTSLRPGKARVVQFRVRSPTEVDSTPGFPGLKSRPTEANDAGLNGRLAGTADQWRLRFHYGSEVDEQRGVLADSELYRTVASGMLR
jgi:hypothetical protein